MSLAWENANKPASSSVVSVLECVVWFACFLFCCFWCGQVVCYFSQWIVTAAGRVQVPYQFTFVAPIPDGGSLYALIS